MITIENIPYFKVYKQKVNIPRNENKIGFNCVAILNNKNLDDSLNIFNHPRLITKNSKYFYFYIDRLYREKIHNKQFRINNKDYQANSYDKIQDMFPTIKTPLKISVINKKNFFYDLSVYNEMFFTSTFSLPLKRKMDMYFKYLNKVINNPLIMADYPNKVIYMSIDSWITDKKNINNPIMYIFLAAKRYPELLESLGNIDIVIYSKDYVMRINPSKLTEKETFNLFRISLNILTSKIAFDDENIDKELEKEEIKTQVKSSQVVAIKSEEKKKEEDKTIIDDELPEFKEEKIEPKTEEIKSDDIIDSSPLVDEDIQSKMDEKINSELEKISDEDIDLTSNEIAERIKRELNNDKELITMMHDNLQKQKTGKSSASIKRDEELRKRQKELKIEDKTLEEYTKMDVKDFTVDSFSIDDKVVTTNDNVKEIKFTNFEKSYNDKLMKRDTLKILENLNNMSIPTYIKDIKIEDSSDELNYKDTYHVILEDENRVRHTLTFDVPKFIEDKFLYLNGNKKIITKQLFMKPVVKTASDTVQICSNYNKIFIRRYGAKLSDKLERFKRAVTIPVSGFVVKNGDNRSINNKYKTTMEYDVISENISSITTKEYTLLFNQDEVAKKLGTYKLGTDDFCIGFYKSGNPIIMSYDKETVDGSELDIVSFILHNSGTPQKFIDNFNELKSGTSRYTYSRATIMSKDLPILLLVGYCEGITEVLRKGNIQHYFTDKKPNLSHDESVVKFADGYLVYKNHPYENALLLNAFSILPTSSLTYDDFDSKEVYVELFYELFKARNLANAFDSFYEFMIDPITKEVLEDLDYPTDFVSVILFANSLLADNSYIMENNMNLYRIRSNEIVNAIIHKQIAEAYAAYRASANNTNPVKISIPKDAIIKAIMSVNTVEEFSTLNPIYESEKLRSITPKGVNGMNTERAYTVDKRSYDNTMLGVLGISTSPDANVGVVRKLTMEPNVIGPRGYINIDENNDKKDINIFTAAEMLTPMGVTHDDSIRTAMASKQSGHIIPVTKSSPVLISNGTEQTIQYSLSKDFIITADDDGEVVEKDEDASLVIVKYKNGKSQAVDIKPRVLKNSSSGFYLSNKLNCDLEVGDKVKKNDIIGYEDKFFTNDGHNKNRFNIGSLQKIAIMSSYSTFEDSTFVTKKMSEEMASDIVMMSDVIIGKNSNIGKIVKVGDTVEVGDILVEYDTSFEEEGLNKFLANISDDLKDEIKSLGKVPIKSKYSGVVEDIKIYSSVDVDELSPSLKKVVNEYYKGIDKKKKLLEKYDDTKGIVKAGILFNEPTGKIKPSADGKIKGRDVFDGVLIEFYIKYFDPMTVGDKLTFYSALKSIIGEVIEEGQEPFSEFRPDEEISAFLGPSAVLARMVPSAMLVMFGNKVLIELKRKLQDIYEK